MYFAEPVTTRIEKKINQSMSQRQAQQRGLTDNTTFSVQWLGYLVPSDSGPTTLWTESDDGVRVYVDGDLVIDNWTDHARTRDEVTIELTKGKPVAIAVQYYQAYGESIMKLGWKRPGRQDRVIQRRFLYPDYPG